MRHFTTSDKVDIVLILIVIVVTPSIASQKTNLLLNSGAEQGKDALPSIWFKASIPAAGLRMYRDNSESHSGEFSFAISNKHEYDQTVCNNWGQKILDVPVGKTIRLSAYIKTKDADSVNVCLQCWGSSNNMLAFASTNVFRGDYDWTLIHAQPVTVPPETAYICVRAVLTGLGEAWFDDLSVEIADSTAKVTGDGNGLKCVMNDELAQIVEGEIIKTLPINKDCMILSYLPDWQHGNVDNIAVANNNGGVRTLLSWPQVLQDDVNDPNYAFLIALYSRRTTSKAPTSNIGAYEILKDWPELTSWGSKPLVAEKPAARFKFFPEDGWKLFDITALIHDQSKNKRKCYGLMFHFTQEDRLSKDWSGYAFVSREGLGEWFSRRPKLLIVNKK